MNDKEVKYIKPVIDNTWARCECGGYPDIMKKTTFLPYGAVMTTHLCNDCYEKEVQDGRTGF